MSTMKMLPHLQSSIVGQKDWRADPRVLERFPEIDPQILPCGARVLCQLLGAKKTSDGGIVLVNETTEVNKWNEQIARVLAVGPIAFCNRETGQPWREGVWVEPGDFVVIPRWGGNRRDLENPKTKEKVSFVTINDHEVIERIYGDPTSLTAYIL